MSEENKGLGVPQKTPEQEESIERNRSTSHMSADEAVTQGLDPSENPRNPNAGARPPRVRMEPGKKLSTLGVEMDESKYKYRWFADYMAAPGRLEAAHAAYWEYVQDMNGNNVERKSASGTMYLMRLPLEYWAEDLALKKKKVLATMDSETAIGPGEYAPDPVTGKDTGRSAVTRTTSDNPYS